ncbi:choice-of-anchor D domain-containing protein [Vicingaceae bacterium]|nr:choice-of-anchor D domain-containing protein [Vicingaceae bacterium]
MKSKKLNILKPLFLAAFSFFLSSSFAQVTVNANTTITTTGAGNNDHIELSKVADSLRVIGLNGTPNTALTNAIQFLPDTVHVDLTAGDANITINMGAGTDTISTTGTMDLTGNSLTISNQAEYMIHNGDLTTDDNVIIDLSDDFTGTGSITLTGGTADLSITATDTIIHSGNFNADVITLNGGTVLNNGNLTTSGNLSLTSGSEINIQGVGLVTGSTLINGTTLTMGANINSTGAITVQTSFISGLNLTSSSSLIIEPLSGASDIGIGNGAAGSFNIDAAEIAGLTDGFSSITIGLNSTFNTIDIQASTFTDPLIIESGTGVASLNGTLTNTGNTVTFESDLTITANQTVTSVGLTLQNNTLTTGVNTLTSAGNVTLNTEDWQLTANGTTVGQFGVIDVTGTVTLTNSTLTITGSHTATGVDAIVIIENDGPEAVAGTFNGLVEGAVVGNGWSITYVGGDGNDIELFATPPAPNEINLVGNVTSIVDGETNTTTGDFTDFGNVFVLATNPNIFTIENTGASVLNLTGVPNMVFISGANADQFSVTAQPSGSTIAGPGSDNFTITFAPTSSGLKQAEVFIYNDDADENPYNFAISGTGVSNEIDVTGLGFSITDGDNNPIVGDDTDFGGSVVGNPVVHTFTIENLNAGPNLNITGITTTGANSGDFLVSGIPLPNSIPGSNNTTFDVTFTPSATGVRFAEVTIDNDDDDENPYNFTIQGNGITPKEINIEGNNISIVDADQTPSTTDDTEFGSISTAAGSIKNTFTIYNLGGEDLTISGISFANGTHFASSGYSLPIVISGGSLDTFDITFDPSSDGLKRDTIIVTSDDADETAYDFVIQGTGTANDVYTMSGPTNNSTYTACVGTLYDDGGPTGKYKKNKTYNYTIDPTNVERVSITFLSFDIEQGDQGPNDCNYDYLEVDFGGGNVVKYCNNFPPPLNTPLYSASGSPILLEFDSDGGVEEDGFEILWEGIISANISFTNVTCNSSNVGSVNDGSISVSNDGSGTGGVGPFSVYNNSVLGTSPFSGLAASTNNISIVDGTGCKLDSIITLTQPNPVVLSETHTEESCAGIADGFIDLSATSDVGGLTYSFGSSPFTGTTNYTGIGTGSFPIVAIDGAGCKDSSNVIFNAGGAGGPGGTASINGDAFFCLADATNHAFTVTGVTNPGPYAWNFDAINPTTLPTINSGQGTGTILVDFSACTDSLYLIVDASNPCGNLAPDTIIIYPSLVNGGFTMQPTTASSTSTSELLGTLGTPSGGTFSGGSVVPAVPEFNPNAAGVGNHIITYTYTDANSCIHVYSDDIDVITNAGGITGLPANENYCHDLDYTSQTLTALEAFSENNITSTTDGNARRNLSLGFNIDGVATGIVFWNGDQDCRIDPSALTDGSHSLNYRYIRQRLAQLTPSIFIPPFGPTIPATYGLPWININTQTVTQDFYVDSIGGVTILGSAFACDDQILTIPYSAQYQHTEGAGVWSAQEIPYPTTNTTGLLPGSNTFSAQFDPLAAGSINSPYRILYDYTSTANGGLSTCTAKDTLILTIAPIPTPSFTLAPYHSEYGAPVPTNPLPDATGNFTSVGVNAIGILGTDFIPNFADTGSIGIIYTYGDPSTSCVSKDTNYTYVIPNKGVISNLDLTYCIENLPVTITGTPNSNFGAVIGTFSIDGSTNPAAINDIAGTNTATFDPTLAGQGLHIVTFSWFDQSIYFEKNQEVFVDSIGAIDIISLDSTCVSDTNLVDFIANFSHPSGIGAWTSSAPSFDTISSVYATINPSLAGSAGSPYSIYYEYTSSDYGSGCKAYDTATFIVHPLPALTFDLDPYYSEQDLAIFTNPIPDGTINGDGNFTGSGMVQADFAPQLAGAGGHRITYWYSDPITGCSNTLWDSTFVIANTGLISSLEATYCIDGSADTLYGSANGGGLSGTETGSFTISNSSNSPLAIVNIGPDTAVFYPSLAGQGNHIITYSYTDEVPFIVEQSLFVDSVGPVYFTGLNASQSYCLDSNLIVELTDEVPTTGTGSFSYNGSASFTDFNNIAQLTTNFVETAVITYTYTSSLNGSMCISDTTETVTIRDLPTLNFDLLSNYCTNDDTLLVVGNPLGGSFDGNGTLAPLQNYSSADSVDVVPGNTVGGVSHTLTYSLTDAFGCANSVDSVFTLHVAPNVQFDNDTLRAGYCELTDPSYPVTGLINGSNINVGYFWGPGITDIDSTDGSADFITDNVVVGSDYEVYYTYTDINNCSNTDTTTIDVYALPDVTLSGLSTSRQYCNNHDNIFNAQEFIGAPPISAGLSGIFVLDTVTTSADRSIFDPTIYISNIQEVIPVSYTYTNNNGCINVAEDTVYVNPAAHPNFTISGLCIVDSIIFTDQTTTPPAPDGLNNWIWTINDSTYTTQNATHKFSEDGTHSANLEIITVAGCTSDTTVLTPFGDKPQADFNWANECFDASVPVIFEDASATVSILDTLNYEWDFDDGGSAFIPDTNYQYAAAGDYNVELIVATNFNCIDTVTKIVSVKPYINTYPYFTDFQLGPDSWTAKTIVDFDTNNSWGYSTWILDPVATNLSWSTSNLLDSTDYISFERTYVSSPCYNFSTLQKPMIRFDMWRDFADIGDGAVLESSIDNGQSWQVVGGEQTTDAGINWYNEIVINNGNGPGGDLIGGQPLGWSDIKDSTWFEVRHDLDHLIGNAKVIFRVAFSANAAGEDKGFAFDNVWIGERSKYVLVEHFTNSSCTPCAVTSSQLNPFITNYSKDLIDIQYHTNAISGDILYGDYQAGPSTRELFYGASQIPQTITDGNILNSTTTSWVSDSLTTRRRALTSAIFDIDLVKTVNGNNTTFDATISTGQAFNQEVDVYMAVIEKQISMNSIVASGGSVLNGETEFNNVVKAMLPDAGGTRISTPWNTGDSQTITETWNSLSTNFYDTGNDDIEVVVFVQNSSTKEIYQTATTDTSFIEIVIGVEDETANDIEKVFSFNLYPNPTSGDLFLMFNQSINKNAQVHIFNELGSLVEKRDLSNGIGSSFSTEKYSEGIYFMSVVYEGERFTKRFMVIK